VRKLTLRKVDIISGMAITIFGVFFLLETLKLDYYTEGVPGPGFFPSVLALVVIATGILLIVTRLGKPEMSFGEFDAPSRQQLNRSMGIWIALLVATLMVELIGFVLAMILLVAAILIGIERRRGITTLATIILIPLFAYLLFAGLLKVPLPTGIFGG
jgi:putative tricarboxylic transport membrane protein